MGLNSASESWRTIRSIRADPPAAISGTLVGQRGLVFQTALEQAQQQFIAAGSIGYESRPLNLFYGLAQAGRAIAAASSRLGTATQSLTSQVWEAEGHGLKFSATPDPIHGLFGTPVKTVSFSGARPQKDLFSRVSLALASPTDFNETTLAELASQIPEFRYEFGTMANWLPELHPTGLYAASLLKEGPFGMEIEFPNLSAQIPIKLADAAASAARYPALRDFPVGVGPDGEVLLSSNPGHLQLMVASLDDMRLSDGGYFYLPKGTALYRGHNIIFPSIGGSKRSLHPLMGWWLILYSLSMISRYSPSHWTGTLALSTSPIASKIEHILETAIDAVPDLVAEALTTLE